MLAAGAAAASPSATAAATTRAFPIETLGDRGADVRAIQGLLTHHGFAVPIDGVFGASTRTAVRAFQAARGLPVDGLVRETTWAKLVVALAPGSKGQAVKVLQRQLNEKRFAHLAVDGVYGTATRAAVITFQKHMGMTANGLVGPVDLADPAVAFRLPGLQRDEPVRLRRRERDGQLGDRGRDRSSRGRGRRVRGDRSRAGPGRRHQPRARWRHRPARDARGRSRRRHPPDPRRAEPVHLGHELAPRLVRPRRDPGAHQDDPGRGGRPRQADLLQRSGAHRRGADALVQWPRRPHPRPLLRAVPPARDLPLRLASRGP